MHRDHAPGPSILPLHRSDKELPRRCRPRPIQGDDGRPMNAVDIDWVSKSAKENTFQYRSTADSLERVTLCSLPDARSFLIAPLLGSPAMIFVSCAAGHLWPAL
jgi:hypothetical protein